MEVKTEEEGEETPGQEAVSGPASHDYPSQIAEVKIESAEPTEQLFSEMEQWGM